MIPFLIGMMALMGLCMYELTNANKSPIVTKVFSIAMVLASTLYTYLNIDKPFIDYNLLFIFVPLLVEVYNENSSFISIFCYIYHFPWN